MAGLVITKRVRPPLAILHNAPAMAPATLEPELTRDVMAG
jgi:hypothetical protein